MPLQMMFAVAFLVVAFLISLVAARIPDPDDLADDGAAPAVVRTTRIKANIALAAFFVFVAAGIWTASVPMS